MTMIVAFVTSDFVLFASDRRRTSVIDESEFYDDTRKIFRVNNNTIIGFSGDVNLNMYCIEYLQKQEFSNTTVQAIARKMSNFLKKKLKEDSSIQQGLMIGGLGDGNKPTIIEMNERENFRLNKVAPRSSEIKWQIILSEVSPHDFITNKVTKLADSGNPFTTDTVGKIAIDSIDFVSKQDKYVSPTYNLDYIYL